MIVRSSRDCVESELLELNKLLTDAFIDVNGVRKSWVMESSSADFRRSLVSALYGNGYGPTAVVLEILAVTLVPVYIATLLGTVMVTNDRQNAWTWMTAGLAVANIGLNLILIPSFHRVGQHGGYAAATAVLITDLATAVGVLVLASPAIRGAVA